MILECITGLAFGRYHVVLISEGFDKQVGQRLLAAPPALVLAAVALPPPSRSSTVGSERDISSGPSLSLRRSMIGPRQPYRTVVQHSPEFDQAGDRDPRRYPR